MEAPYYRRAVPLLTAVLVLSGLALIEWMGGKVLASSLSMHGLLAGLALGALPLLLALAARRARGELAAAALAALMAVAELVLGAAIVFALAASGAALLPLPLTQLFMQGDRGSDFIIFGACGLALLVAGRATLRHLRQQRRTAAAQLEAAQAQACLAERERALAQAETAVLRAQIEPHFLWNTLAHVQYLAGSKPDDAAAMTGHLIRYLRAAVPSGQEGGGTIGSEIDSVRAYLELMKMRMGPRLDASCELAPELSGVPLAPLLLHTLVENAIKHGIEPKSGPVRLCVSARCDPDAPAMLLLEVRDTGVGLQAAPVTRGSGMGLRSVRERLAQQYGDHARLSVAGMPGGGVLARISLPFGAAVLA